MTDATPKTEGAIAAQRLAALLMLSPRRLQQLAQQGIVQRGGADRDEYLFVPSIQGYINFLRQRSDAPDGASTGDVRGAKTRLLKLQTDKLEIDLKRLANELLPADEVRAAWQSQIAAWNSLISNAVPELVNAVAGLTDVHAIQRAVSEMMDRLRTQMAETDPLAERVVEPAVPVETPITVAA